MLISAFVFAGQEVQFLFLNPKFQASNLLLRLYRPVCVGPGRNPNCWFSHAQGHISIMCFMQSVWTNNQNSNISSFSVSKQSLSCILIELNPFLSLNTVYVAFLMTAKIHHMYLRPVKYYLILQHIHQNTGIFWVS